MVSAMVLGRLPGQPSAARLTRAGPGGRAVYSARTKAMQLGKRLAGSLDRARATMGRSASGRARSSGSSLHVLHAPAGGRSCR